MRKRTIVGVAVAWVALGTSIATASQPDLNKATPGNAKAVAPIAPVVPAVPIPSDIRPPNGYWSVGTPRWFVSSKSDLGGIYAKPYFSAGYGLPHWIWAGADVNAISTLEFGQVYAGVRGSTPLFDVAFGARDTYSYGKKLLDPRPKYVAADLYGSGKNARYWAWELEVVGAVPLPHAAVLFDYIAVRSLDVPRDKEVYDESYRLIVADPFFQLLRVAAVARLLKENALKVGVLTEFLTSTGRDKNVFRVGPAFAFQVTDHLEALGTLSVAVVTPDSLGLALGAYGLAGVRYRWATGERAPALPWQGP